MFCVHNLIPPPPSSNCMQAKLKTNCEKWEWKWRHVAFGMQHTFLFPFVQAIRVVSLSNHLPTHLKNSEWEGLYEKLCSQLLFKMNSNLIIFLS